MIGNEIQFTGFMKCCCVCVAVCQLVPTDSSEYRDEDEAAVKAKRSKPDEAAGEEVVYHPVKLSRSDLYRPPTAEELNQLKEAESLFHCSLLKMQVRPLTLPTVSLVNNTHAHTHLLKYRYMCG